MLVALMLLMIMTILSLSGISNSTLETRMARNYYQGSSAFQNAEYALRVVEDWLSVNVDDTTVIESYFLDGTSFNGLYNTVDITPTKTVTRVCRANIDCVFEPMNVDEWCSAGSCDLPQGFVTLGDTLEGSVVPLLAGDLPAARRPRQPQFIIEFVGPEDVQPDIIVGKKRVWNLPNSAFRITVIAWGRDEAARQVLQSHIVLPVVPPV